MKLSPTPMYTYPERTTFMAGLAYGVIAFFTFPFLSLYFSQGFDDAGSLSWFEVIYHVVNFLVAVYIFREYLKDSFMDVECNLKSVLSTIAECSILILAYSILLPYFAPSFLSEYAATISHAALPPMVEMEIFNMTRNLILVNPVVGTGCAVLLAPVTISCLYYASSFAPVCGDHPWLAYPVVAIILAIPRICNALTFWPFSEELILYLTQLPVHFIACAAYHKTDTVWAPIAVHAIVNFVSCIMLLFLF